MKAFDAAAALPAKPMSIGDDATLSPSGRRLAIVTTSEVVGGHEFQLVHLANALRAQGPVTIIATEPVPEQFFRDQGLDVRLVAFSKPGKIWRQWRNGRKLAIKLAPVLADFDSTMVSGGTIEACVAPARALQILRPGMPVTAYIPMHIDRIVSHGVIGIGYNYAIRLFTQDITRFITINRIQARLISRHYRRPVDVMRNVITPIAPPTADHGPRLVYIGRLDDGQKNVSGAIALLDHPDNPFRALHIFGDGPDRYVIEAQAERARHLTVVFHGWASHERLARELGRRDLLVMNSRWEGEPLIVRELAAAGIGAVATDIPGFRGLLPRTSRFKDQAELLAILKRRYAQRMAD